MLVGVEEQKNEQNGLIARPSELLAVYGVTLIYVTTLGSHFARLGTIVGPALFTLGIALIPLAYVSARRLDFSLTFPFGRASRRELLSALMMTVGLVFLVLVATSALSVLFPSGMAGMNEVNATILGLPDWAALLTVAVLPAVCEELFFRGFALGSLCGVTGKWAAIGASAALFGIVHMDPFRIPIAAGVGVALGFVAWETRSLVLPMLMHATYNLSLVVISRIAVNGSEGIDGATGGTDKLSVTLHFDGTSGVASFGDRVLMALNILFIMAPFVIAGIFLVRLGARGIRKPVATEGPSRA